MYLTEENGGEVVTNAESAYWILADTSKKQKFNKKAATKIIPNLKKLTQESLSHQQQKQPILKKNRSKRQQHKEQEYEEQQEYQEQEYQEHDEQETPHLRRSLRLQKIQKPSSKPQRELSKKKNVNVIVNVIIDLDDVPSPPLITQHSDQSDDNHELPSRIKLHSSTTTLPNKSTQLKSTKISSSSLEEQSKSSPNTTPSTIRGSPCSTKSISPLSLRSPLLLQMSSPVIQSSPVTVNNPQLPSKSLSPPHSRPRSRPCSVSPNERPIIIIENNIHNRYQNIDERDNNEEVFIGGIVIGKSDAVDIYSVNNNLLSKNSPETPLSIIVNEMELDM
ncbi:2899_t:CDS:2 [Entrophospora sp. SA101]|nr:2899_t:CDS:2 [Entrophospora sp. SA101]